MLIAHATDLSGSDDIAFEHALALAAGSGSRLVSVHACVGPEPSRELPDAAELLARWGKSGSVEHERILHTCCDDATETLLDAFERLKPDLVVLATHARTGLDRLLGGSVAEGVARNIQAPMLVVPLDGERFVDARTGSITLQRLLAPAGSRDEAQQALDAAGLLAKLAQQELAELVLLHVADGRALADPKVPVNLRLTRREASGPLDQAILECAKAVDADALVMVTRGHDGLIDVLLGSHTERVLHECRRPMLWVPHLKH